MSQEQLSEGLQRGFFSFPGLGCTKQNVSVQTASINWRIYPNKTCAGSESRFTFQKTEA